MNTTFNFPIVIAGVTCAGKTSFAKALVEKLPNVSRVVSYTTRAPRKEERDGVDYHFISNEKFGEMLRNGQFVEHTTRASSNGVVFYGTAKADFMDSAKKIAVMDLVGVRSLKSLGIDFTSVLLNIDENIALDRAVKRGDSKKEVLVRLRADSVAFTDVDNLFDLVLDGSKPIEENIARLLVDNNNCELPTT